MKLIKVKDLKIGDEIIVPFQSNLRYLKVLSTPKLKRKEGNHDFEIYYLVKCTVGKIIDKGYFGEYEKYGLQFDVNKHCRIMYLDLNWKDILLIKREEFSF